MKTFKDFLASFISITPDEPSYSDIKEAEKLIDNSNHILNSGHNGTCVGKEGDCQFCALEIAMQEYSKENNLIDI